MNEKDFILIVDDDEMLLDILRSSLALHGYRFETASNAESATELLNRIHFGIMITDLVMPGVKGFEFVEKAKKLRPDMAIIVTTGFIDDFSYDKAIEAGASDFLKKPFTIRELIARIKHVQLHEEIRSLSFRDELTGLYNRRGFFTLAEHLFKMAKRNKTGIYILYADMDDLKQINDTWGHQEGDSALIETAHILTNNYRESDIIARIGGDEFVVIPVGTSGDSMDKIVGRLQRAVEDRNVNVNQKYLLSISAGTAFYDPENPCTADELLDRADKSMYEYKKSAKVR